MSIYVCTIYFLVIHTLLIYYITNKHIISAYNQQHVNVQSTEKTAVKAQNVLSELNELSSGADFTDEVNFHIILFH